MNFTREGLIEIWEDNFTLVDWWFDDRIRDVSLNWTSPTSAFMVNPSRNVSCFFVESPSLKACRVFHSEESTYEISFILILALGVLSIVVWSIFAIKVGHVVEKQEAEEGGEEEESDFDL